MSLREKEPLEQGQKRSGTLALPEALWEALDKEVVLEDAKSRSSLARDILIFGIYELRRRRAAAAKK